MYSLNVPVPGEVAGLAWDLRSALVGFERQRDELTLVVKRLNASSAGEFAAVERAVREELAGTPPIELAIDGLDLFADPIAGPAPVLYLDIESPGVEALHRQLVNRFDPLGPIEGKEYVPHITLARGGDLETAEKVMAEFGPTHRWTANRLVFWDGRREVPAGEISLPA